MSFENNDEKIIVELNKLKKIKEIYDENNKLINEFFRDNLQKKEKEGDYKCGGEKVISIIEKKNIDGYDYSLSLSWYSNEICQLLRENLYQYKYKSLTRSWSIHKDEIDYICSLFRKYPEWKIEWN